MPGAASTSLPTRHPPVVEKADLDAVAQQLGREPRGVLEIAYRCPNGEPAVVKTAAFGYDGKGHTGVLAGLRPDRMDPTTSRL